MPIRKVRNILLIGYCLGVIAPTLLLRAQTSTGNIVGTVTDTTGAVLPGAAVTLTNAGTSERRATTSDAAGNYQFVNLIPGNYRLEVESRGFKRYDREAIRVEVESSLRIDARMEVGDVAETLTVSAETPLLQTQTATVGQLVEGERFRKCR